MHPLSAKYFKSDTVVLGPKESRIEFGDEGGATGDGDTIEGVSGSSSFAKSKAEVCWIARRDDVLEVEEAALALLEVGTGEPDD
jgi:hypothetical protein